MSKIISLVDLKPFLYSGFKNPEVLNSTQISMFEKGFSRNYVCAGGVAFLLRQIQRKMIGTEILVAMDSKHLIRKEIDKNYKANRSGKLTKADYKCLNENIELAFIILEELGIDVCMHHGYEADDVIASAVKYYGSRGDGAKIDIYTPDSDLSIWISPNVEIRSVNSRTRDILYDPNVPFHLTSLLKASEGDAGDNIPPCNEPELSLLLECIPEESLIRDRKTVLSLSKALFPNNKRFITNIELTYQFDDLEVPSSLQMVSQEVNSKITKILRILSGYESGTVFTENVIQRVKSITN